MRLEATAERRDPDSEPHPDGAIDASPVIALVPVFAVTLTIFILQGEFVTAS